MVMFVPRINRGSKIILLENILSLEIGELLEFYKQIINAICQNYLVSFLLEPVVARVKLQNHSLRPLFLVLNYGSVVFDNEYINHIVNVIPQLKIIELLDPIWAKALTPRCIGISICGVNKSLGLNNVLIDKSDSIGNELNICYGKCCSQVLSNIGLTTSVKDVSGKIVLVDKDHFITYGLDEILCRFKNDVKLSVYSLNEYEKAPVKPLVSVDSLPIIIEILGRPCIAFLIETNLNELNSYIREIITLLLLRSIIYVSGQIK